MDSPSQLEPVECSMAIYAVEKLQGLGVGTRQQQGAPLPRLGRCGECGARQPVNSKDPGNVGITFVQLLGLHQRPNPLPRA